MDSSLLLRLSIFLLFIPSRLAAVFIALATSFARQHILGLISPHFYLPLCLVICFTPSYLRSFITPPPPFHWRSPTRPSPARIAVPLIDDGAKLGGPQSEEQPLDAGSNLKGNSADRHRGV